MGLSVKVGFLENCKVIGKMGFLILREPLNLANYSSFRTQYIVKDPEFVKLLRNIPRESFIECRGYPELVQKSKITSEVLTDMKVLNEAIESPPVDFSKSSTTSQNLKDPGFLKDPKYLKLLILRSEMYNYLDNFFYNHGYVELSTPKLVDFGSEGGSEIFKATSDKMPTEFYLVQSPQIYKQLAINAGLKKVYEISNIYRAEKFKTSRHSNETLCLDVESGELSLINLFKMIRCMIVGLSRRFNKIDPTVKLIKKEDFKWISYKRALKLLDLENDDIITTEQEFLLISKLNCKFLFLIGYPSELRPFYTYKNHSFDLLSTKCEICSGSRREVDYYKYLENLKSKGIQSSTLDYYLRSFKYGVQPSIGFGLGLDRLLMVLLDIDNIEDTKVFLRELKK